MCALIELRIKIVELKNYVNSSLLLWRARRTAIYSLNIVYARQIVLNYGRIKHGMGSKNSVFIILHNFYINANERYTKYLNIEMAG